MNFTKLELELAASLDADVYAALCKYRDLRGFKTLAEAHTELLKMMLIGVCNMPELRISLSSGSIHEQL